MTCRLSVIIALVICLVACGSSSPTSPTTAPGTSTSGAATTFALSGTIRDVQTGAGIAGALAKIADGPNANKTATADGSGHYALSGLVQSGFTLNFSAPYYNPTSQGVTLTSSQIIDASLAPIPIFATSGVGDNTFSIPSYVTKIRVDATYSGSCSNFIVHLSTQSISLINVIIGTCSVADTRSPFTGTYSITGGGTVQIMDSTGVSWMFTEIR